MTNRFSILCCVAGVLGVVSACGSSDAHRETAADAGPDAGPAGATSSSGGSTGSGGKGGATASGGAAGASGGSGGSGGASVVDASVTDASVTDAAPEASTSTDAGGQYVCPALADGGAQWRNFSTAACVACPGAYLGCSQILAAPGPSYDEKTHLLTLHVTTGTAEVMTASVSLRYSYVLPDAGGGAANATIQGAPHGDTITFDLSSVPGTLTSVQSGFFTFVDACGQTSQDNGDEFAFELGANPDGGAPIETFHCWVL